MWALVKGLTEAGETLFLEKREHKHTHTHTGDEKRTRGQQESRRDGFPTGSDSLQAVCGLQLQYPKKPQFLVVNSILSVFEAAQTFLEKIPSDPEQALRPRASRSSP